MVPPPQGGGGAIGQPPARPPTAAHKTRTGGVRPSERAGEDLTSRRALLDPLGACPLHPPPDVGRKREDKPKAQSPCGQKGNLLAQASNREAVNPSAPMHQKPPHPHGRGREGGGGLDTHTPTHPRPVGRTRSTSLSHTHSHAQPHTAACTAMQTPRHAHHDHQLYHNLMPPRSTTT